VTLETLRNQTEYEDILVEQKPKSIKLVGLRKELLPSGRKLYEKVQSKIAEIRSNPELVETMKATREQQIAKEVFVIPMKKCNKTSTQHQGYKEE
jgi:hypothetical protein